MSRRKVLLDDQELAQQPRPAPRRRIRTPRRNLSDRIDASWETYRAQMEDRWMAATSERMNQMFFNQEVPPANFTDGSSVESEQPQAADSDPSNPGPVSPPSDGGRAPAETRASVATDSNGAARPHENEVAVADRTTLVFDAPTYGVWYRIRPGDRVYMDQNTYTRMDPDTRHRWDRFVRGNELQVSLSHSADGWFIRRPA